MSLDHEFLKELVFDDLERELLITRRVLEAVPAEKFTWKPHEKSMTLQRMAFHVAQMPEWMQISGFQTTVVSPFV